MKPVQLAVAGAGLAGKSHIAAIGECPQAALSAVVDPAPEAAATAKKFGAPLYKSLPEMFARRKPDGVILATPNNLHLEHGLECVRAGCPVLVEKPVAARAADGAKLVKAAAAAAVPVLVGHHRRHNALVQKARDIIASGKLGELRAAHSVCWLYKPDDYFDAAAWRKEKGAGPIAVNLVHDVDLLRYFCGDVETVQAQAAAAARGYDNEDVAAAVLRFRGGALATVAVADAVVAPWSWELTAGENSVYPYTGQSCYFFGGSHGALSLPDLTLWESNGVRSWHQPLVSAAQKAEQNRPLAAQIGHFADVINGKAQPLVSGGESVKTLQVVEAIRQSAAAGKMVEIKDLAEE